MLCAKFYKKCNLKMCSYYISASRRVMSKLWSFCVPLLLATVMGQGPPPPPPDDGGGPPEQEVALLITSPIYVCEDDVSKSYMKTDKVETVRHNESVTYVKGELEMLKAFDPATVIEIVLNKKANGKKETMFSIEINMCEELAKEADSKFYKLLQYLAFPKDCNIVPGMYKIDNLIAELDDLPINSGNMGDYEAQMTFNKCEDDGCAEKTFEACVLLDCVIEPV